MPHFVPGVSIRDSGVDQGRAQVIDFDTALTATVTGGVADVDGTGGGGGSALGVKDEGVSVDAAVADIDVVGAGGRATQTSATHVRLTIPGSVSGVLASRPAAAAANEGMLYNATDGGLYISDGATWTTVDKGYIPGGTDVAVADGGTGASTAAAGLANLGGVDLGTSIAMALVFG